MPHQLTAAELLCAVDDLFERHAILLSSEHSRPEVISTAISNGQLAVSLFWSTCLCGTCGHAEIEEEIYAFASAMAEGGEPPE